MNISNGGNNRKTIFYNTGENINKIKSFDVIIRDDDDKNYYSWNSLNKKSFYFDKVNCYISDILIKLWVYNNNFFDNKNFKKISYNRGYIKIIHD
jgi:hypothetical protein